jgi:hypothetical protein
LDHVATRMIWLRGIVKKSEMAWCGGGKPDPLDFDKDTKKMAYKNLL